MHSAITRSPSSGLPVCPAVHEALGPSSATAASRTSGFRAVISTFAPASTNAWAMPLPIPFEPPVITAALPSMRRSTDGTYCSEREHPQCDAPAEQLLLRGGERVVRRTVGVTEQALDARAAAEAVTTADLHRQAHDVDDGLRRVGLARQAEAGVVERVVEAQVVGGVDHRPHRVAGHRQAVAHPTDQRRDVG